MAGARGQAQPLAALSGLSLEEPLLATLMQAGLDRPTAPVFLQFFEVGNLRELAPDESRVGMPATCRDLCNDVIP